MASSLCPTAIWSFPSIVVHFGWFIRAPRLYQRKACCISAGGSSWYMPYLKQYSPTSWPFWAPRVWKKKCGQKFSNREGVQPPLRLFFSRGLHMSNHFNETSRRFFKNSDINYRSAWAYFPKIQKFKTIPFSRSLLGWDFPKNITTYIHLALRSWVTK